MSDEMKNGRRYTWGEISGQMERARREVALWPKSRRDCIVLGAGDQAAELRAMRAKERGE